MSEAIYSFMTANRQFSEHVSKSKSAEATFMNKKSVMNVQSLDMKRNRYCTYFLKMYPNIRTKIDNSLNVVINLVNAENSLWSSHFKISALGNERHCSGE